MQQSYSVHCSLGEGAFIRTLLFGGPWGCQQPEPHPALIHFWTQVGQRILLLDFFQRGCRSNLALHLSLSSPPAVRTMPPFVPRALIFALERSMAVAVPSPGGRDRRTDGNRDL